jgi:hypothetical protein
VLDKKDAESSKRRVIGWKRIALLLLLLLTGFVLYESGILSSGPSGKRIADKQMNNPSSQKYKETYRSNTVTGNKNNDDSGSYNSETIKHSFDNTNKTVTEDDKILISPKHKENTVPVTRAINNETGFNKSLLRNKIVVQNDNPEKEQSNSLAEAEKINASGVKLNPDKNIDSYLNNNDPLPKEKTNPVELLKEISIINIAAGLTNSIKQLQLIKDSLLKNSTTKKTKEKKTKLFKPFWMLTAFASYERAGYRLDSDIPNNITSIKHSEVHEPSFTLGILTTRQLKKHWGLQTGLVYSQTDVGITPQKLYALQDPTGDIAFKYITSSGFAYIKPGLGAPPSIGDSLTTTEGKHRLKYISVPFILKYSTGKGKLTVTPGAGIEANFVTSAKIETEVEKPFSPEIIFINKLDGAKQFYVSIVADAELRYRFRNKLSLSIRPAIRFATTPITENNVVETFPCSVGVGIGLTYKF